MAESADGKTMVGEYGAPTILDQNGQDTGDGVTATAFASSWWDNVNP